MRFESPDAFLTQVLRAFRPYLGTLVLIGGFAVRCYARHPRAVPTDLQVLRTLDVDFALPSRVAPVGGQTLAALAAAAGFVPDFRGDLDPPVMKFVPQETHGATAPAAPEEYSIEFLTPLHGRAEDPAGRPLVTATIQPGLTAQRLRFLDLLLEAPWSVTLAGEPGSPAGEPPLRVQLPHPGCFLTQKLLIADRRDPETERPKDMAYLYQVVQLFARDLPTLGAEVRTMLGGSAAQQRWLAHARQTGGAIFASPGSAGVTEARLALAAEVSGTGTALPSAARIHAAVRVFLEAL